MLTKRAKTHGNHDIIGEPCPWARSRNCPNGMQAAIMAVDLNQGKFMQFWIFAAAINGCIAVAMGAMGSHMLSHLPHDRLVFLDLGSDYQLWHALGLVGVGLLTPYIRRETGIRLLKAVGTAFTIGIVLFSGGLYILALMGTGPAQWLVPVGGTMLILGWLGLSACSLFIEPPQWGNK